VAPVEGFDQRKPLRPPFSFQNRQKLTNENQEKLRQQDRERLEKQELFRIRKQKVSQCIPNIFSDQVSKLSFPYPE